MKLTQDLVRHLFEYDASRGVLIRKVQCGKRGKIGTIAGSKTQKGYFSVQIDGKPYFVHRVIFLYVRGRNPEEVIDHINGIKGDNRIENLREITQSENNHNRRQPSVSNKSGYLGVCWSKAVKKWHAKIRLNNIVTHLGYFDDPKLAHATHTQTPWTFGH